MATIKSDLFALWSNKERQEGRRITIGEVSSATGLNRDTISGLLHNKTTRFDSDVIAALCDFFGVGDGEPVPFLVVQRH